MLLTTLTSPAPIPADLRSHWRRTLLAQREAFALHPDFASAEAALGTCLQAVVQQLMPDCLGLYWPLRGEFNAPQWSQTGAELGAGLALPFAQRQPIDMHYRAWDGQKPEQHDECGIPCAQGEHVVPDVVLVPCVGYTRSGHRLGFGAGYFDRWLAAHPHVTAVGVAWSLCELPTHAWQPQAHDQPLMLIVTENGVVEA